MKHIKKFTESEEIHYDQSPVSLILTKDMIEDIYREVFDQFDHIELLIEDSYIKNIYSLSNYYLDDGFQTSDIPYIEPGKYNYILNIIFKLRMKESDIKNMGVVGDLLKTVSFCTERIDNYNPVFSISEFSTSNSYAEGYKLELFFKYNFIIE